MNIIYHDTIKNMNELSYYIDDKQTKHIKVGAMVFAVVCLLFLLSDYAQPIPLYVYVLLNVMFLGLVFQKSSNLNSRMVKFSRLTGAAAIAVVGLIYFLVPAAYEFKLLAAIGAVFFSVGGILYAKKMRSKKEPILKLTHSSITVNDTAHRTFTWDEITSLSVVEQPLFMQKKPYYYLAVVLNQNVQNSIPQPTGLPKVSADMIGSPFFVTLNHAAAAPEIIITEIKAFLETNNINTPLRQDQA